MNAKSLRYLSSFILALLLGTGLVGFNIFALSGQVDTKDTATVGLGLFHSHADMGWFSNKPSAYPLSVRQVNHHEVMTGRRDETN